MTPLVPALVRTTACLLAATTDAAIEKLRNDKVAVTEFNLKPGESVAVESERPVVVIYFDSGSLEFTRRGSGGKMIEVHRGDVIFDGTQAGEIKNVGTSSLRFVRTEFLTIGGTETWGATGLSPNYKLLVENRYARVYDVRIPAGTREPQHTHKQRVVICLSGATLKHLMPDGREEPSTLKTGEIAWRSGGTHIGQNLDTTDLWVIAIEPK